MNLNLKCSYLIPALFVLVATDMAMAQVSCRSVLSAGGVTKAKEKAAPAINMSAFDLKKSIEHDIISKEISDLKFLIKEIEFKKEKLDKEVNGTPSYRGYFGKRLEYSRLEDDISEVQKKLTKVLKTLDEGPSIPFSSALGHKLSDLNDSIRFDENGLKNLKADYDEPGFIRRTFFGEKKQTKDELREKIEKRLAKNKAEKESLLTQFKRDASAGIPKLEKEEQSLRLELKAKKAQLDLLKLEIDADRGQDKAQGIEALKKLSSQLDQAKAQLTLNNAKLTAVQERERVRMSKALSDLQAKPATSSAVTDLLGYYSATVIPREHKVTVLVGDLSRVSPEQKNQLTTLIEGAMERGYFIVYDANSKSAGFMAELTQEFGIGVLTSSKTKLQSSDSKVVVSNDYLRMKLFAESAAVVSSPESTVGLGLMMEGLLTHVLDASKSFEVKDIQNWQDRLDSKGRNLGIAFSAPKVTSKAEKILSSNESGSYYGGYSKKPSFNGLPDINSKEFSFELLEPDFLTLEFIQKVAVEAISFSEAIAKNAGTGGAVVFGSSRVDPHSAPLIYESSYKLGQLGYAVATGGAGGAMEVANSGAFNGGGVSIGIPISGRQSLATEATVASSTHTKTINTSGYEERIPVLLDSRKLVIFAPGGNGTIKELATALVRIGGKSSTPEKIVFLDQEYYGGLVEWLMASNLPTAVKDRIILLDKAEEVEALALSLQEKFEADRMQAPRKDQPIYKAPSFYGSSKKSDKFKKDGDEKDDKDDKDKGDGKTWRGYGW